MDLHEEWKKWQESEQLDQKELDLPNLADLKSNAQLPLKKLKKQFKVKMALVTFFTLGILTILFFEKEPLIQGALAIILLFYIVGGILTIKDYQLFKKEIPMDKSMLSTLESISVTLRKTLNFEEKFALFIYPISFTGGFMLGFSFVTPLEELFQDKTVVTILIASISISTPLCYFFSKKLNQKMFGKYLDRLDSTIEDIRNIS